MNKFKDVSMGPKWLEATATLMLERHKLFPSKVLEGFVARIGTNAEMMRALIGTDVIRQKAMAFLEVQATKMKKGSSQEEKGGVQTGNESHAGLGSSPTGGVHEAPARHDCIGPASSSSSEVREYAELHDVGGLGSDGEVHPTVEIHNNDGLSVSVTAHSRHKPGNARRGLAAMTRAATVTRIFSIALSDGSDFMQLTHGAVKRIIPNSAFDAAMAFQALAYAQVTDDTVKVSEFLPQEIATEHAAKARKFSRLAEQGVSITVDAFLKMEEQRLIESVAVPV